MYPKIDSRVPAILLSNNNLFHDYSKKPGAQVWVNLRVPRRLQNLKATPLEKISLGLLKTFAYLLHPNKSVCFDFLQT